MGEEQTQPAFDPGNIISPDFNGSEELKQNHYIRRSHEQGNYEITPTYTGSTSEELIVVPAKPGAEVIS